MSPIRVALVDEHRVVRQGIRTLLESFGDLKVVGEASSGEEALREVGAWAAHVVVMDLLMPGGMGGIEAIRRIRQLAPGVQVVALTSYTEDARVVASLRAGAVGYVRKDAAPEVLLSTIRAAAHGRSLLDPAVAAAVFHQLDRAAPRGSDLTDRERDMLRQLALGRSNREIADTLVISGETVKTHVASILSKLGLANRTQVIIYALKQELVTLDEIEL